jgi:hypothetical protein
MSPIRPEDRARYPKNWKTIVGQVRQRSGGRCECTGECGLHCTTPGPRRCTERNGEWAGFARGRVVLTVAHRDHTPEHCDLSNLVDMCQRCHLRYDRRHHAGTRQRTRETKTGQQNFLRSTVPA